ncbi:MAG TPA: DUF2460 domain-containing protein [Allosphingosinicella sp.]|jgi:uncharacterized protein (TIGR02217 family)
MGHWLVPEGSGRRGGFVKRFAAPFWSVDFPRPMMASVHTTGPSSLRVECQFYRQDDLAGLIWAAEDRHDHVLLRYETSRDFRRCRLSFRWRSGGIKALDAPHGPTLTIEGRDERGAARTWLVRLWNYAQGTAEDAAVSLDFADLKAGFAAAGEAVFAGDVDRMFISLVAPGYTALDEPLAAPAEGWAELSEIRCDGSGSVLALVDVLVPEHGLRIATGYDDLYHLSPERVLRNILQLGYRGPINHYVGMSHFFRLAADGKVDAAAALNVPCAAWHRDFAERAKALGFEPIWSLSYELLDQHCPEAWKQRAADGTPALTGWVPPSALLSPANDAAMDYLASVASAFATIADEAGLRVRFQAGEPWWWVTADGRICLYDAAAAARFAPVAIADVRGPLSEAQLATLDAAGAVLAESTAALCAAVKAVQAEAETLLLAYLPTVLDAEAPEVKRANLPLGWAWPAFDVLQLEDYDWAAAGARGATARGVAEAAGRLGYAPEDQHYFAGFVLRPEDRAQWHSIAAAAEAAFARGAAEVFVWALPQVMRDGFVWFGDREAAVEAYDDVLFPLAIGREASVEPGFSTAVVATAGGGEQRNSDWADARMRFDAGPGVRGEAELGTLIAFFRARRGAAKAFRFRDPFDDSSSGMTGMPWTGDQLLGTGDGARTDFALVKDYDGQERRITRPVPGSVRVSVDGVERIGGWILGDKGVVSFGAAPAQGAEVRAGFRFDVPVRFEEDRLQVSRATFKAGEAVSVPLVEVREG